MLQQLEPRRLLSGVTTTLNSGLLTVNGTSHADDISIDILANGVTVRDAGVVIFSSPPFSTTVFAGIVVNAGSGGDKVFVNSNEAGFRTTVNGQSGDDDLTILAFHGQGGVVRGGSGDDTITTDTEITGSSVGADIQGGSGDDEISATHGSGGAPSVVEGGSGDDEITVTFQAGLGGGPAGSTVHGGSGDDVIHGSSLNDQLFGESGKDQLFGNAGNDFLNGGAGKDQVDGGADTDTATNSNQDTFLNVENLV